MSKPKSTSAHTSSPSYFQSCFPSLTASVVAPPFLSPPPPAQVFGIILVSVFAYDAFKIYRTELMTRTTEGEYLCPERGDAPTSATDISVIHGFPAWLHFHRRPTVIPGLPGSHSQTQEPQSPNLSSLDSLNHPSAIIYSTSIDMRA